MWCLLNVHSPGAGEEKREMLVDVWKMTTNVNDASFLSKTMTISAVHMPL